MRGIGPKPNCARCQPAFAAGAPVCATRANQPASATVSCKRQNSSCPRRFPAKRARSAFSGRRRATVRRAYRAEKRSSDLSAWLVGSGAPNILKIWVCKPSASKPNATVAPTGNWNSPHLDGTEKYPAQPPGLSCPSSSTTSAPSAREQGGGGQSGDTGADNATS